MGKRQVEKSWNPEPKEPYGVCPACGNAVPLTAVSCPHTGCDAVYEEPGADGLPSDPRILFTAICDEIADMVLHKRAKGTVIDTVSIAALDAIKLQVPHEPAQLAGLAEATTSYLQLVADIVKRGIVPPEIDADLLTRLKVNVGGTGG